MEASLGSKGSCCREPQTTCISQPVAALPNRREYAARPRNYHPRGRSRSQAKGYLQPHRARHRDAADPGADGGVGVKYLPVSEELGIRPGCSARAPKMWAELMDELRETHLGAKRRKRSGPSAGERLQAAYEAVGANRGN